MDFGHGVVAAAARCPKMLIPIFSGDQNICLATKLPNTFTPLYVVVL
jgi:hypothetical protein